MKATLPQPYFSRLCRAIIEFDMIQPGDKILIGLSGGKDSTFLTYALACLQKLCPTPFEIAALTIDPKFSETFNLEKLADFCDRLQVPFYSEQVDIAGIIKENDGKDPCFTCSFFRRGAINRFAVSHGYNKIAYAHHHDDAVETFLMSILFSGQIKTFSPATYLDRTRLTVIRPLIYFRERELHRTVNLHGFTPMPSPCPLDGYTKRQEVKEMIREMEKHDKAVYAHLSAAMRQGSLSELWPPPPRRDELRVKHMNFWNNRRT
jgi:tRNA(Ile)-lysidine synthase TilS/MesJ